MKDATGRQFLFHGAPVAIAADMTLDDNDVKIETALTWYNDKPNREAHGDFTIDSGEFTLGAILSDNFASTNKRLGWDGNSLTKLSNGTLTLSGTNTYTGTTTVSAGTLTLSGSGSMATSKGVDLASGTSFDISGISVTGTSVKELSGSSGVNLCGKNIEIGSGNTSAIFSGDISGLGGSLLKTGTGTLTLSGANTHTGGNTISSGKLIAVGMDALGNDVTLATTITGTGGVTITGSGTLTYTATNTYAGPTTVSVEHCSLAKMPRIPMRPSPVTPRFSPAPRSAVMGLLQATLMPME